MYKLLVIFFFITTASWSSAQTQSEIDYYTDLNDKETRLESFKDSKEAIVLKLKQLEHINKSRKKYKAPPVKLDILASRMANQIAREAARNRFGGHFNLAGEAPFIRFANSGGTDHVTENAGSASYQQEIEQNDKSITYNMQMLHNAFMAEKAPNDGHKKACIDKAHNYVGIGYAIYGNEFRYYEEYLDRYLAFKPFKNQTKRNKEIQITFKPTRKGDIPYFVIVYHQPVPDPMTPAQIDRIESYQDFTDEEHLNMGPWEIPEPDQDGYTSLNLTFKKKGYYYIQLFLSDTPHKTGSRASTKGKIQASGVVIRVE